MLPLRNRICPLRVVRLARLLRVVEPAIGCLLAVFVAPWEAFNMDHPDFDRLARTMTTGASRRSLLRRMAASAIASPMGFLGITSAQADGKDDKNKKNDKDRRDRGGNQGDKDVDLEEDESTS